MSLCHQRQWLGSRRQMLQHSSLGFGWMALHGLLARSAHATPASHSSAARTAKRVLFLCMRGGPSHVDTFDHKPSLDRDDGKSGPRPGSRLMRSPWSFQRHGESGLWMSELFPQLSHHADKLCMIHSMQTDVPAHPQAMVRLHTGTSQFVRPSVGAWVLYGLGSANENLPGFVSISPPANGGASMIGSAFLPAAYQGTRLGNDGRTFDSATLPNLSSLRSRRAQRQQLDYIQSLNRQKLAQSEGQAEVEGVIESYELAFRMQSDMPKVLDLTQETETMLARYGADQGPTRAFGRKCLLARRLLEEGVRFVEVTHGNWDQHQQLRSALAGNCLAIDRPIAGLLEDLESRGMLEDTLVVWSGEFGRTPYAQGNDGRDHNHKAFTLWMAGGPVRAGFSYGTSGEHGIEAMENPVPIVDFHATLLALLGIDHEQLTYNHAGRDFRLTDVAGRIVREVMV